MQDGAMDTSAEDPLLDAGSSAAIRLQNMLHIVEQLNMQHLVRLKVYPAPLFPRLGVSAPPVHSCSAPARMRRDGLEGTASDSRAQGNRLLYYMTALACKVGAVSSHRRLTRIIVSHRSCGKRPRQASRATSS